MIVAGVLLLAFVLAVVLRRYFWFRSTISEAWLGRWVQAHPQKIWLGHGLRWRVSHSRQLYARQQAGKVTVPSRLGFPHALMQSVGSGAGNNLVLGAPGSGKTVFFRLLATQAMERGEALLILDPKGGGGLYQPLKQTALRLGRPWYQLLPQHPEQSDGLNPLALGVDAGELASRIARLLPQEESDNVFGQFAWMTLSRMIAAFRVLGIEVSFRLLHQHLLNQCLVLEAMLAARGIAQNHPVLQGVMAITAHDRTHFQKMILALSPVMETLATGHLGEMLSPPDGPSSRRWIGLPQLLEQGGVLYVGLGSLINSQWARMLGGVLLSDLASLAGTHYHRGKKSGATVQLMVDEAAEVANPALLQLMNKGRECGWVVTLAVQTLADLEHAQGSRSGARILLGNAANIFAFRTLDQEGRQWLMDRLSSVWLAAESHSSGSQWSRGMMGLQGKKSDSRSWHYQELPMIPESLLASLPNLHYMGLLAGQTLVAGRVPLIRQ
jgi:conjugal transfer pilus assembly protein TraD